MGLGISEVLNYSSQSEKFLQLWRWAGCGFQGLLSFFILAYTFKFVNGSNVPAVGGLYVCDLRKRNQIVYIVNLISHEFH